MMLFVIFLCLVAGCACLELQRADDCEKNLKSNNYAMEAVFLAANGTINEDRHALSKDATAPDQPAVTSPSEIKASDKPRSAVTTTTMTSDVKRSGQTVYVGRRVIETRSVFKQSLPNISALRYSMKGRRRFPGTSAAIRDTDKDFAIHRKGSSREKRQVGLVPRKLYSLCFLDVFVKALYKEHKHFPDIKQIALESLKKEVALVDSLAKSGTVSTDVLNEYKAAKTAERKYMHQGLNSYSAFEEREFPGDRKRKTYDYEVLNRIPQRCEDYELRAKYGAFLDKPSPARDRYKAMKAKEDATFQSYFDSQGSQDIYEGQTENEFEGLPPVDNNAEPDFECPKKKRESGSVAPKMRAQIFVILICVVIVILISGLQGLENDEDDNNARKDKRIILLLERSGSQELRFDSI